MSDEEHDRRWKAMLERSKSSHAHMTDDELRQKVMAIADRRGGFRKLQSLSEEQQEWQWYWYLVVRRLRRARRWLESDSSEYVYEPPTGALMVREGRSDESPIDRLEREMEQTKKQLASVAGDARMLAGHIARIEMKFDAITARLNSRLEGLERRLLRVEESSR